MSASVLDMSMSLDGYIADPDDFLGGEDGERLHKWADVESGPVAQFADEWNAAGAVLAGRRTAELMDHWAAVTAACRSSFPVTDRRSGRSLEIPVGDVRERWDRKRHGTGEGCRR